MNRAAGYFGCAAGSGVLCGIEWCRICCYTGGMSTEQANAIQLLTPEMEKRIQRNPLLHIDTFIIPSPYILDSKIEKDYTHSYVWIEEGEILGYLLVYSDADKRSFNIYKLVTSPFGRGRGIGTLFIEHLAQNIPADSTVYLYLWEKQTDTLEFFQNKGFNLGQTTVYRNLVYYHLFASRDEIAMGHSGYGANQLYLNEEIGKTRHDARKTIRLLSSMVDMLTIENCGKIIEDINRETTTLINILNAFRDTMSSIHEVNLKDLLLERIVPYIEASSLRCRLNVALDTASPIVLGYYVNFGRALVNIVSNALEAIAESGRKGLIEIEMKDEGEAIVLRISDNGVGIAADMLEKDRNGYPAFVGNTTKNRREGEGLGSIQIYSTFGPENIHIDSTPGEGTAWTIQFRKPVKGVDKWYVRLERRFNEFKRLSEGYTIDATTSRTEVIAYIWQLRKIEIFLFDLILQFSKYHNIRTIYRVVLSFFKGSTSRKKLEAEFTNFRCDNQQVKQMFLETTLDIRRRLDHLWERVDIDKFKGALFKSYGQAIENVMIFTLDPENGNFLATDRKLAEHLDFAPYLKKEKEQLVRGEFIGDMNNHNQPIFFGVWSIVSDEDLINKLKLMQKGARRLLEMGIHRDKKLSFYQTTYVQHSADVDSDASSTFGEFAELSEEGLRRFTRETAEEDMLGFMLYQD